MKNEHYTAKGETYVLWRDSNSDGYFSLVPSTKSKRTRRGRNRRNSGPYRDRDASFGCWVKLFGLWFFVPRWAQRIASAVRFQVMFFFITVIASHIIFVELPVLLRPVLEP